MNEHDGSWWLHYLIGDRRSIMGLPNTRNQREAISAAERFVKIHKEHGSEVVEAAVFQMTGRYELDLDVPSQ